MKKTPEQRKAESIGLLIKRKVPHIAHLPVIEGADEAVRRTGEEIRTRALALSVYFMRGQFVLDGAPFEEFVQLRDRLFGAEPLAALSPTERAFVLDAHPTEDLLASSWAIEGVLPLLWACGAAEAQDWPSDACDLGAALAAVKELAEPQSAATLKVVDIEQLLDAADLSYRLLWACRNARLRGTGEVPGLNTSVVWERHRALSWLVRDGGWDEVDMSS